MGQDQGPYGDAGGFTPYQPDATPDSEPAEASPPPPPPPAPAPAPFVPYGGTSGVPNVPYGGAPNVHFGGSIGTPIVVNASGRRWLGWVVGIAILLFTCGGSGIAIIAGLFNGDDSTTSGTSPDIAVPSIELPSLDIPSFDIPSIPPLVFANDLVAGQCLVGAGFDPTGSEPVTSIQVVDCTAAHDAQVLEINVLDEREAADYDFDDDGQVNDTCTRIFSKPQKALFKGNRYFLLALTQTRTPAVGDKVACLVVRGDGGPIRGYLPRDF